MPTDKKEAKEKRGFFGSKKSGDGSLRKSKSFKRIRGFLKGNSSKQKLPVENDLRNQEQQRISMENGGNDHNVHVVEDRSVVTIAEGPKPFLLKIVLLLMDPVTRRFELLQLEFDSLQATVNDILVQIPASVTEDVLREQRYTAICGPDAIEKSSTCMLSQFCSGNEVLVAIPDGLHAKECIRLATPILSDDKVTQMLKASGIDASEWKDDDDDGQIRKTRSAENKMNETSMKQKARGNGMIVSIVFMGLLGISLQVFHLYISAPIRRGNIVSPNIWLRQCGLNFVSCDHEAYFRIKDDKAIYLNGRNEIVWMMEGGACEKPEGECQPGMQVKLDGSIVIGDEPVRYVTMYKESTMSPWPFAEEPRVTIQHVKHSA